MVLSWLCVIVFLDRTLVHELKRMTAILWFGTTLQDAGSTSSVELVLDGKSARCGRKTFVPSPTQLQRGGKDEFVVETSKALGPLQRVVIGIKDGSGSDWHLEKLEVTDVSTRACYTYPANRYSSAYV